MAKIALSEMIENLRQELQAAVEKGKGESIRLGLDEVVLEAQVQVEVKGEGKGKINFWVVDGEIGGGGSRAVTQKIVLKMTPETSTPNGGSQRVKLND